MNNLMYRFLSCVVLAMSAACSDAPPPAAQDAGATTTAEAPRSAEVPTSADTPSARETTTVAANDTPSDEPASQQAPSGAREMEWDALIPDDYRPDKLMQDLNFDELSDDDPRAAELTAKLRELWDKAPVRDDLDGVEMRLPGFVVPVETSTEETTGFLLVPYYGACVHVPPPPANQTVYVVTQSGMGFRPELFEVVWVTGTMSVATIENDVAKAGYTLYATAIAPYE